jgi:release factor glutamine methyltransferase
VLLSFALGRNREWLYAHPEHRPDGAVRRTFDEMVRARAEGCPVAYLTNRKEFAGLDLAMRRGVFIPRPETEGLLELAESWLAANPGPGVVVDACCGSGAIAVALAVRTGATVIATDISASAVGLARENAARHGVSGLVAVLAGRGLTPLGELNPRPEIRAVVSNPPYVTLAAMSGLPRDVAGYEPRAALEGGPDGLGVIRELLQEAGAWLGSGGLLALEMGADQAETLPALFEPERWGPPRIARDLAGLPRYVLAVKTGLPAGCPGVAGDPLRT